MKPYWWNLWHQFWDCKTPHILCHVLYPCLTLRISMDINQWKSMDINGHSSQICISIHHLWFPEDVTVVGGISAGSSAQIAKLVLKKSYNFQRMQLLWVVSLLVPVRGYQLSAGLATQPFLMPSGAQYRYSITVLICFLPHKIPSF